MSEKATLSAPGAQGHGNVRASDRSQAQAGPPPATLEEEEEEQLAAHEAVGAICAILDDRDRAEQKRILKAACVLLDFEAEFHDEQEEDDEEDRG